jgi:hypothetical protein
MEMSLREATGVERRPSFDGLWRRGDPEPSLRLFILDRFPPDWIRVAMTSAIQINRVMPAARSHDLRAQPRIAAMSPESFSGFSLGA